MVRRAAGFIAPGDVVAVDSGLPSPVTDLTPPELGAWFLRSNGMLNNLPLSLADAAAITRGGYVNLAIVNAARVDAAGGFAGSVSAAHPGLLPPGNSVDLASGARRVIAMLSHTGDDGAPGIVRRSSHAGRRSGLRQYRSSPTPPSLTLAATASLSASWPPAGRRTTCG